MDGDASHKAIPGNGQAPIAAADEPTSTPITVRATKRVDETIPMQVYRSPVFLVPAHDRTMPTPVVTLPMRDPRLTYRPRPSAPLLLRMSVILLSLIFLGVLGGFVVLQAKPRLFTSLRAATPAISAVETRSYPTTLRIRLLNASNTAATYQVPTASYALVVTITQRCWVTLSSPPGSPPIAATTLVPAQSPKTFLLQRSSSITVAARTVSIRVVDGAHTLGTIADPAVGYAYNFDPVRA